MDKQGHRPDDPAGIAEEYRRGIRYKQSLGVRGMAEQNRMNERFFAGDQWYGANCGNDRPLARYNVIKRIGDYKMAVIGGSPLTVSYSAEGVPNTLGDREAVRLLRRTAADGTYAAPAQGLPGNEEINLVMSALSDYFDTTAERVRFDALKSRVLRDAYQSGTGILYTYWDPAVRTGLYAGGRDGTPITGDVACEVLDIEDVYFGDPGLDDLQAQPYILIAQRRSVAAVRQEARQNGAQPAAVAQIRAQDGYPRGLWEGPEEEQAALVLTRFWKERDARGRTAVFAVRVCGDVVVRPRWDTGVRLYPLAAFRWEPRRGCAYGDSEITYLIPNQIAINRMLTANVWSAMMTGMPLMLVNGDVVPGEITNDPGQILRIYGSAQEADSAVRYVSPPGGSPFESLIEGMVQNTLTQAGANEAALGDMQPNNTSAILALREAATLPLQPVQERFYGFCEEVARVWAEFWVMLYGDRELKIEDESGTWYFPFRAARYRDLLISTRVDVSGSVLWNETQTVQMLDNLLEKGVIDGIQYLERLPKGAVAGREELIRELRARQTGQGGNPPEAQDGAAAAMPRAQGNG
ncbi:MAG TPA: hypothetical protein H9674_07370 [Firmicutes bacterium]|nr:hypothetical protein [Bacillota bacterium]